MARPKKKIQKRQKVFNVISSAIDLVKYKWKTTLSLMCLTLYFYVVFFSIDTLADIVFEMRYM
jgi:hypothetical protein